MSNTKQDWLNELLDNQENYELVEYDVGDALREQGVNGKITCTLTPEAKQAIAKQIEKEVVEARIDEIEDAQGHEMQLLNSPYLDKRLAQLKDISTKLGEK